LSRAGAFDGLRIHTDEINEVIARITPSTLSVAVVSYTFRCYHCQLII
jgi:betaine lipid synthase